MAAIGNQKPLPLRAVPASRLIAANVYISEGRDKAVIDRLVEVLGGWRGQGRSGGEADVNSFDFVNSSAAKSASTSSPSAPASASPSAAALVHVFVDEPYNRTGFTIAGLSSSSPEQQEEEEEEDEENTAAGGETTPSLSLSSVPAAISLLAKESLKQIDWRLAGGTHPAIGVVDHVAIHPLFPESQGAKEEATRAAREVARSLGKMGVPTYLYGSASVDEASKEAPDSAAKWRKLAEVRRALGYFAPSPPSKGGGGREKTPSSPFFARFPDPLPSPDRGPSRAEASKGAAAVGSVPWVMNVNVPLVLEGGREGEGKEGGEASSLSFSSAAAVARAVSARRGTPVSEGGFALPGVEALALVHEPGIVEIACNLTDGNVRTEEVARAVEAAALSAGFDAQRRRKKKGADDDDSSWYVTGKRPEEVAAEAAGALGLDIVK